LRAAEIEALRSTGKYLWRPELQALAIAMKRDPETAWLAEVPAHAVLEIAARMDKTLRKMLRDRKAGRFAGMKPHKDGLPHGFPVLKKKFVNEAGIYAVNQQTEPAADYRSVKLPKLGSVRIRGWRNLPGRLVGAMIKRDVGERWMLSVQVETEIPESAEPLVERVGIDLGIRRLATIYDGHDLVEVENRRPLRKLTRRLRRFERSKSRRRKGSARRRAMARRIGLLHRKIRFQRSDALHQLSHLLTIKAGVLVIEDLNVKGMQRGRYSRQIGDVGLGTFLRLVSYKAEWRGRQVIKADRFFPSSQTCSGCGLLHKEMKRGLLTLRCECGTVLNRDGNAAINLYWYGGERRNWSARRPTRGDSGDQGFGPVPLAEPRMLPLAHG
jgi:putative transposase